ncbi:MAG: helix-turn-helix domain-containing protein [Proteobacteria bacterium]|nr:helix-turn-helix domain-containing protein [Pseudomonadota bacterium]
MPAASELSSVIDRQLLLQLGARLKRARVKQGLTTTAMAERAGISRMTLSAIEAGEPTPTMGSYLRVMSVLQVSKDLVLLASETLAPPVAEQGENASGDLVVSASNAKHELQDLQSLMLHEEAVRLMQKKPELVQQALDTLDRWRQSGDSHSRFLWDEWSVILHRRAWRRALSHTKRSKELRQASPLTTILPPETRQRILDEVRRLKSGVPLGSLPAMKQRPAKGSPNGT